MAHGLPARLDDPLLLRGPAPGAGAVASHPGEEGGGEPGSPQAAGAVRELGHGGEDVENDRYEVILCVRHI